MSGRRGVQAHRRATRFGCPDPAGPKRLPCRALHFLPSARITGQKSTATEDADVLFVAGCEENQVAFHPRFDVIILLSAPAEVLIERLTSRTANCYGKSPAELARVLDDLRAIEPRLRRIADHEIRTTIPLNDVVSTVLRLADARPSA